MYPFNYLDYENSNNVGEGCQSNRLQKVDSFIEADQNINEKANIVLSIKM
jgi:hypothetical protein